MAGASDLRMGSAYATPSSGMCNSQFEVVSGQSDLSSLSAEWPSYHVLTLHG